MSADPVGAAVAHALCPGCFFVAPPARLWIEHVPHETIRWEVLNGHLLDVALTREEAEFAAWNVWLDFEPSASAPLISIKWHAATRRVFVTRQILTHAFEAYEDSPGVILSRPVLKWIPELVATIDAELARDSLASEVTTVVSMAVMGTSRLPITSVESPLPAFSLGQLGYLPGFSRSERSETDAVAWLQAAMNAELTTPLRARALETALRSVSSERTAELASALCEVAARNADEPDFVPALFRALFNQVALSPYTAFVERLIALLTDLTADDRLGGRPVADLLGYMSRNLCRHLTAFDLTLFHNFGANYPDALFLDALIKATLRMIEERGELYLDDPADTAEVAREKRLRRRGLRQAALLRKQYEGHRVPDAPTSLGEHRRALPADFARVPEEQIMQTAARRRRLFGNEPLESFLSPRGRQVLDASLAGLSHPPELRELGLAIFLDRPLGVFKPPGQRDDTPLVSAEAFSRSTARRRLIQLHSNGWTTDADNARYVAALNALALPGTPAGEIVASERPGVVSLADAQKAAPDFVYLRTLRRSLDELLAAYDWQPLARAFPETAAWLQASPNVLLTTDTAPGRALVLRTIQFFDRGQLRLELGTAADGPVAIKYRSRGGVEWLESVQVLRVAEPASAEEVQPTLLDVRDRALRIELRPSQR